MKGQRTPIRLGVMTNKSIRRQPLLRKKQQSNDSHDLVDFDDKTDYTIQNISKCLCLNCKKDKKQQKLDYKDEAYFLKQLSEHEPVTQKHEFKYIKNEDCQFCSQNKVAVFITKERWEIKDKKQIQKKILTWKIIGLLSKKFLNINK
eukprot:403371226